MELEIQKALRGGKSPEELHTELGLNFTYHPTESIFIVNYDQLESPKTHHICKECRGLTLTTNTYDIVAKSFDRFFNHGEALEETEQFNWKSFFCNEKVDGSLIIVFKYNGHIYINTRGSFGDGLVGFSGKTWRQLVFEVMPEYNANFYIAEGWTYIFELVGPANKVVRSYNATDLYLLTIINNESGKELSPQELDVFATSLQVKRPIVHYYNCVDDILSSLLKCEDATFEGYVLQDVEGRRLKVKNTSYLSLHRMRGNNGDNLFNPKNLIPLILSGEKDEILTYFKEVEPAWEHYEQWLTIQKNELISAWIEAGWTESQKEFAQFILPRTRFASILFHCRKTGEDPMTVWRASSELIVKGLKKDEYYQPVKGVGGKYE